MIYGQRDPKWAKETLGFGKTTIGSHGCFVTSLSIMCGKTPSEVNGILKKGKFFTGDLIISSNAMAKTLGLTYVGKMDSQPKFKTIAEVDMSPAPGKQQHFVVVKEDGSIIDPWTGTIRPKGTYNIMSYRLFNVIKAPSIPKEDKNPAKSILDTKETISAVVDAEELTKYEKPMLDGKKTYIGLAIALAGVLGATKYISPADMEKTISLIAELIGIGIAIYGRYKAK